MIGVLDKDTKTYDSVEPSVIDIISKSYISLSRARTMLNTTETSYYLQGLNAEEYDNGVITGSYFPTEAWSLPKPLSNSQTSQRKLTLKQARDLAVKSLLDAERRRQLERDQEAKYWSDID